MSAPARPHQHQSLVHPLPPAREDDSTGHLLHTEGPDAKYRSELLQAALGYATKGWHVFPLRPGTKKPAVPNHPAHLCDHTDPRCADGHTGWEARATTDPDRITRAWTRRPYGIGIACGPSGLLVVDLDTASEGGPSGVDTWSHLNHGRSVHTTFTVATPSGGHHRYYRRPHGVRLGNTASRLGPRVDTRATGGYVVAAPTATPAGEYRVTCGQQLVEAPAWLVDLLTPADPPSPATGVKPSTPLVGVDAGSERVRRYVNAAVEGETRRIQNAIAIGTRNNALFKAALALGQLVGADLLDQETAERVLWANTTHHLTVGAYTRTEAAATIASGLNRGRNDPRRLPTDLTETVSA